MEFIKALIIEEMPWERIKGFSKKMQKFLILNSKDEEVITFLLNFSNRLIKIYGYSNAET